MPSFGWQARSEWGGDMAVSVHKGKRLPATTFGEIQGDQLRAVPSREFLSDKRVVIVGVPAAFSPICTRVHLPKYIELAPRMRASGFDEVICLCSSGPWAVAEWASQIDPEGHLRFLSDGNLQFGHACGLVDLNYGLFLSATLKRFSMIVDDWMVEQLAIESSAAEVTCSAAGELPIDTETLALSPGAST